MRTQYETGNTQAVLNGDIDQFIEESIKKGFRDDRRKKILLGKKKEIRKYFRILLVYPNKVIKSDTTESLIILVLTRINKFRRKKYLTNICGES